MIDVFYTKFEKEIPQQLWDKYSKLLPREISIGISKYVRWQDRHAHLFGKLLLLEAFKHYEIPSEMLSRLKYNEYSRPYLSDDIDFNISHSGKFVVCSIGKNIRLGIDVEECTDIAFNDYFSVMTKEQWEIIHNSSNSLKTFFSFWTRKESVIKADSRGLSISLQDIHVQNDEISYDNNTWYLNNINLNDDYCTCLACNKYDIDFNFLEVDFYQSEISYSQSKASLIF